MRPDKEWLGELQHSIGYVFNDFVLLTTALTHKSYANESKDTFSDDNERLEFLGDAVLSIIVSDYLFKHFQLLPEGDLTRIRSSVVNERSLAGFARKISLGSYLRLSKGEQMSHGFERDSILADAFEAVIAAVYLDGEMEAAKAFLAPFIRMAVERHLSGDKETVDYKTLLQELTQQNPDDVLKYVNIATRGPDHDREFRAQVQLNDKPLASAWGKSKKQAEQRAAEAAIEALKNAAQSKL